VHGSWHGAWCWAFLADELAARGHRAITVDLPAEDPTAGAREYAAVVAAALPGPDAVLVGHSLAGLTVPVVAAANPVRQVVYLAAMLPEPGRSVAEGERQTVRGLGRGQTRHADGSTSWEPAAAVERLFPDSPPDRAAWAAARLRRQHWLVMQEVTPLASWPDVPSTYLRCAGDTVIDGDWAARAVPARLGIQPVTVPGDHSPFLSRPAALADLLTPI